MSKPGHRLQQLRRRILEDPASVLFVGLSEEYRRLGLYEDAAAVAEAGLRHHPSYTAGRLSLARALAALGHLDRAKTELEAVLRQVPDNLAALRLYAALLREQGPPGDAAVYYRAILRIAPNDAEARQALARLPSHGDPPRSAEAILGLDDADALERFVRSDDTKDRI